jgi:hypothetical protein
MAVSVDESCLQRVRDAVESILLVPDKGKGFEDAFLQLIPLAERDFENPTLRTLFKQLMDRHDADLAKVLSKHPSLRESDLGSLKYKIIPSRSKCWFKEMIWKLYRGIVECDD